MTVSAILNQARRLTAEQEEAAQEAYRNLVHRLAAGEAVAPEEVLQILPAADKTPDQLKADIARVEQRATWAEQLDDEAEVKRQRDEMARRLAELDRQIPELQAERKSVHERALGLNQRLSRMEDVRRQLAATCDNEEILEEFRSREQAFRLAASSLTATKRQLEQARGSASRAAQRFGELQHGSREERDQAQADVDRYRADVERLTEEIPERERLFAEAKAERERFRREEMHRV